MGLPLRIEPGSPLWPVELDRVEGPPDELWLLGREQVLARRPRIAVVGTRSPSPYGLAQAERFAGAFARAGVVVVSGLARGIDQAAHAGALSAGGDTLAVLGSGVDRPWPASPVTTEVTARGLLLSEYRPGQGPRRHHFPLRNRLIAGLCAGVLVVEAAWASGSLITARWAADQGKEVFALPGRVDHPMARGTLRLAREGATAVGSPEELLQDLFERDPTTREDATARSTDDPDALAEGADPTGLLSALRGETLDVDELARRVGRPIPSLLADLVILELAGAVARAPGGLYRLLSPGGRARG